MRFGAWVALLTMAAPLAVQAAEPPYRLADTLPLGGTPRWDYLAVDAAARLLYVAHDDELTVVDLASRRVAGHVAGLAGAHGVAIVPSLGRGFVTSNDRGTLNEFALDGLHRLREAKVGAEPDCVAFDPATQRLFVFSGAEKSATVLDARSLQVVATVALGGAPEFAVADGKGAVFVNLEDTAELVRIDAPTASVAARSRIEGCEEPHALAFDAVRRRLYSSCANQVLAVVDAASLRTLAQLPIGRGSDAIVVDAVRNRVYVANGEGFVSVIDAARPRVLDAVQTRVTGRTMAVDPGDGALLVPAVDLDIDWSARTARFAPDGLKLYRFVRGRVLSPARL